MNKIIAFIFLLLLVSNIFAVTTPVEIPTITKSVSTGTTYKFTETLSGKLPTGYKVKIDLNNGKGLVAMTCAATTCTLSSNILPKGVDSASYKVGIYDAKGVLQGTTTDGTYVISSTATTSNLSNETSSKSFYTKISNLGEVLPDTAIFGSGANDWACTKDNKTGLIWEVKTDEPFGLRGLNKQYTDYFVGDAGYGESNNAYVFVSAVNKQKMCGASDWRLPTVDELKTLVFCSDDKYGSNGSCYGTVITPTINKAYFPNTQSDLYWSSSRDANNSSNAWHVYFGGGGSVSSSKYLNHFVRLVR